MKISDGFDARRLRPKGRRNWGMRIVTLLAALLAMGGVLLMLAGISGLIGHPKALGDLDASPGGAAVIAAIGLVVLYLGIALWRRCRRRRRQAHGLSMSAHLMKKHD
jgi:membrane protein implicated in regulation of membrane protease activity